MSEADGDLHIVNHGSIVIMTPVSTEGQEWVDENVEVEQFWGINGIVVEPRYIGDIIAGASDAGLRIVREW